MPSPTCAPSLSRSTSTSKAGCVDWSASGAQRAASLADHDRSEQHGAACALDVGAPVLGQQQVALRAADRRPRCVDFAAAATARAVRPPSSVASLQLRGWRHSPVRSLASLCRLWASSDARRAATGAVNASARERFRKQQQRAEVGASSSACVRRCSRVERAQPCNCVEARYIGPVILTGKNMIKEPFS